VSLQLPRATTLATRLEVLAEAGSTNTELVARAAEGWPDRSVLVTDRQTAGRGRLGRDWTAPPGTSLAVSVLVRPAVPAERYGWLSLLAGVAMAGAIRSIGGAADLKWPNDVLLGDRKVCGILAEALPDGSGAVLGAGLNHRTPAESLPVPTATSLLVEGLPTNPDAVLAAYLSGLWALLDPFEAEGGDPARSGLHAAVERVCGTLGSRVRVQLPDGANVIGRATGLDLDGRLVVAPDRDARPLVVAAGDVTHLRYE
jgi:BirA family biotin operon repressor/biotin-[acetyl-CoA-carboxylase] ligase